MKIGIITMHKVINYGSALQAFALQQFLLNQKYSTEIIDYLYYPRIKTIKDYIRFIIKRKYLKYLKFKTFWKKHYILSSTSYNNKSDLTEAKCQYDIYVTGSDQVWNPMHQGEECAFMFDFIGKDKKKISYAASFSTGNIPDEVKKIYAEYLSQYRAITVRERNAVDIIKQITEKNAPVVCDPTLLLNRKDWAELDKLAKIKINEPYILAYILTYAYDPYPYINHIIEKVQNALNMKVVFLDGKIKDKLRTNSIIINSAGPYDFLSLISNASFVITTSFHGTAFSINYRKPFYSIIQSDLAFDSRMYSLLETVGLEDRALSYNKDFTFRNMAYSSCIEDKIESFVEYSKKCLLQEIAI